jgi:hypothetical protein
MNEQVSRQLVQQAYQSVKAGDDQSLLNSLTEDVQWQLPEIENVPFAGTWNGREQVGQFWQHCDDRRFRECPYPRLGQRGSVARRLSATPPVHGADVCSS